MGKDASRNVEARRIIRWVLSTILLIVVLVCLVFIMPIPPKRTLYQEDSPDGTMMAVYSYRPEGLHGWVLGENSYIYVDVYRKGSKDRLVHAWSNGDVPWEAIDRLHRDLPWPAKRTTGNPLSY